MQPADLAELFALAAMWGGSFLFMRLGAGEFGPVALAAVRVIGASLFLLPLVVGRGQLGVVRQHWKPIAVVGLSNSALPFLCFSYAALSIPAGLSSIFNAATPLFGAVIAWLWLKDRLSPLRSLGLLIGFAGVVGLAWDKAGLPGSSASLLPADVAMAGAPAPGWAILACMAASLLYGWSASFTKRHLAGVAPLAVAGGSQLSAALVLVLPAVVWWPAVTPSATAWASAAALAVVCTGVAYVVFFRLIGRIGPANTISVTFLNPLFAVLWGGLILGERLTLVMVVGCGVIVFGTSLAIGLLRWPR